MFNCSSSLDLQLTTCQDQKKAWIRHTIFHPCRWPRLIITFTSMDTNRSWWQQQFGTNRIYLAFWGNHMTHIWSYIWKFLTSFTLWISSDTYVLSLLSVDYIIAPLKVLQSLKESVSAPDEKYSFVRRLSPQSAATYSFSKEQVCFLLYSKSVLSLASQYSVSWTHRIQPQGSL